MRPAAILLSLLCGSAATVSADPARHELTPFVGWHAGGRFSDDDSGADRSLNDGAAFGLILNRQLEPDSQWEVYLSRQQTRVGTATAPVAASGFGLDVVYVHAGGNISFDGLAGAPYFAATLGATRLRPSDGAFEGETRFSAAVGGGLKIPLAGRVGLRVDLRAFATVVDTDSGFFCRSDIDGARCAVRFDGRVFWQIAAGAGVLVRF